MRQLRKAIEVLIPVLGMVIVLGAILFILELRIQIVVAVIGLLIIDVGVWGLARPFLPNERQFLALRSEVDHFIILVRRLNAAALEVAAADSPEAREHFEAVRADMTRAVDRMSRVAGRTDDELTRNASADESEAGQPVSSAGTRPAATSPAKPEV